MTEIQMEKTLRALRITKEPLRMYFKFSVTLVLLVP